LGVTFNTKKQKHLDKPHQGTKKRNHLLLGHRRVLIPNTYFNYTQTLILYKLEYWFFFDSTKRMIDDRHGS